MAKRLRAERVVELIDQFLEEEDFPESSDNELDVSVRCDFVDEDTGEEILLTNIRTISSNNDLSLPCESDSLLLNDTQLHCNGKYYMIYSCLLTNFVSILDSRESDETNDSFYSPQTTSSSGNSSINISLSTSEESDTEISDKITLANRKRSTYQKNTRKPRSKCSKTVRSASSKKKNVDWKWEDIPNGVLANSIHIIDLELIFQLLVSLILLIVCHCIYLQS